MQRTLAEKDARRKRLRALPYPEKVRLVERMRVAAAEIRTASGRQRMPSAGPRLIG